MRSFVKADVIGNDVCGFGISVLLPSGMKKEYAALYANRLDAEDLCDKINRDGVSECHVYDIIEDALP